MKRKVTITAKYLPGSMNVEADRESRQTIDSSEWKVKSTIFMKLCQIRGRRDINLFSSGVSPQLPQHISRKIDPFSQVRDAFHTSWAHKFVYAFSPFTFIGRVLRKENQDQCNAHNDPSIASPTIVSRASKNVYKTPTTSTSTQRSTERSCRKVEPIRNAEFVASSGLGNLRQNLLAEGISERVSNLITNNRRTSLIKHYKSAWMKGCGWCSERDISPTRSNINYVLDFLAELFEKGLEYRTIGTPMSTISEFHEPVENIRAGNRPRVSALMSGIFNKRPPQPEYPFI